MRTFLFSLALFFFSITSFATHQWGGEVSYEYIGPGTTASTEVYEITLILYFDKGFSNNQTICISSSCFSPISATLNLQAPPPGAIAATGGGYVLQNNNGCMPGIPQIGGPAFVVVHEFKDTVTLPGKCADWKFTWDGAGRNGSSNLIGSGDYFDFTAQLNNNIGPNSSPRHLFSSLFKSVCVGAQINYPNSFFEADGDSVRVELSPVYNYTNPSSNCPSNHSQTPANYGTGFTYDQPITTQGSLSFTQSNMSFTPSQVGLYTIGVRLSEYRFDPVFLQWIAIGSSFVEHIIFVAANCDSTAGDIGFSDTVAVNCGDSIVTLSTNRLISVASISPDGSDFRCISPAAIAQPIIDAQPITNPTGQAQALELAFHMPFNQNGIYLLYLKTGNDGNGIFTDCGIENKADTIYLKVTDCPNIGLEGFALNSGYHVYPNPTKGSLNVTHQQDISITISSLNGQKVLNHKLHGTDETFDISDIPNGLYFLQVKDLSSGQLLGTTKIIKQ